MAQHIGINEVDESGGTVRSLELNFADIQKGLFSLADSQASFPWLSSIDEYGDTLFNYLQVVHLVQELNLLRARLENLAEEIDEVLYFVKDISNHQYIKFIGD